MSTSAPVKTILVVDLTHVLNDPFATTILGDLQARLIPPTRVGRPNGQPPESSAARDSYQMSDDIGLTETYEITPPKSLHASAGNMHLSALANRVLSGLFRLNCCAVALLHELRSARGQ
jgi:hypothetical protein